MSKSEGRYQFKPTQISLKYINMCLALQKPSTHPISQLWSALAISSYKRYKLWSFYIFHRAMIGKYLVKCLDQWIQVTLYQTWKIGCVLLKGFYKASHTNHLTSYNWSTYMYVEDQLIRQMFHCLPLCMYPLHGKHFISLTR